MRTVPTFEGNFTLKSVKNEPWNAKTRKKARKRGSFSRFFRFFSFFSLLIRGKALSLPQSHAIFFVQAQMPKPTI